MSRLRIESRVAAVVLGVAAVGWACICASLLIEVQTSVWNPVASGITRAALGLGLGLAVVLFGVMVRELWRWP